VCAELLNAVLHALAGLVAVETEREVCQQQGTPGEGPVVCKAVHQRGSPIRVSAMPGGKDPGQSLGGIYHGTDVSHLAILLPSAPSLVAPTPLGHGTSSPAVCARAASNRRMTSAQFATFHQAFTYSALVLRYCR
jgi:hypothetical protein